MPLLRILAIAALLAACGGADGGTGDPGPSPQPSPSPSPLPSPAPSTGPGIGAAVELAIEPIDVTGDCAGMVPAAAPPVVVLAASAPAGSVCLGGTGDGTGHVAVGARSPEDVASWTVFSPAGARTGSVSERGLVELVRQPRGWLGLATTPLDAPFEQLDLVHVTPEGTIDRRTRVAGREGLAPTDARIAGDPTGGSAVAVALAAVGGNHFAETAAFSFDAAGARTFGGVQVMTDSTPVVSFLGAGASSQGGVLVSYRLPGAFAWSWLGADGSVAAQGQVAQAEVGASDPVTMEPLLDGAIAVAFAGRWGATVPHLATAVSPPPEWLAARSGAALRFTRGNRGYAVLPPPGEQLAACAQVVELRSRSGRLCGRVTMSEGGTACTTARVEQGWDGTLIHASARDACSGSSCTCTVHVWPRLLAGG